MRLYRTDRNGQTDITFLILTKLHRFVCTTIFISVMLKLHYQKRTLIFRFQAGTSRGVMTEKDTYFLKMSQKNSPQTALGEASPLKGLSVDDLPNFEDLVANFCQDFNTENFDHIHPEIFEWIRQKTQGLPSIRFAAETVCLDWLHGGKRLIFENDFAKSQQAISINGLIWMGSHEFMRTQIEKKIKGGFTCLKMKIGAIDFEQELSLLKAIRKRFSAKQITLRVDANGAFLPEEALDKLNALAVYDIHSIEQPIKKGQIEVVRQLCEKSPIPIALDEELIGIADKEARKNLLKTIQPHFIILKPTLVGGIADSLEWIEIAEKQGIAWWFTSALESNIGLNAISQLTACFQNPLPQGLGTGQLYENNIDSPLEIKDGKIWYNSALSWASI